MATTKEQQIQAKKDTFLNALEKSLGIVSTAAEATGISRMNHYFWNKNDEEYAKRVQRIKGVALDFVESALFKSIKSGNVTAQIFYLKTQGKERGYIEKQEVEHQGNVNIAWKEVEYKPKED